MSGSTSSHIINSFMEQLHPRIKYFLYARKSSESEDRQVASIDSQIENMKKDAAQARINVLEVLSEARSAKAPGRSVFNQMLQRIYRGEAQGIVCWKLDRLARNPVDGGQISWMLQQGLIKHIRTHERDYYPADNVLMMSVEFGMANQFVRDLSTSVKRGMHDMARHGRYPARPPLGYVTDRMAPKGQKSSLKDPERFNLVRKIFDTLLTGAYTGPQAYKLAIGAWGLRTRRGTKMSLSHFYRLISSPFYYGLYEFPAGSGNWYRGTHEPMITQDEYDRIQALIRRKGKMRPQKRNLPFIGTMQCGGCGAAVTAEVKIKRQKCGTIHRYVYYRCTRKKNPRCHQKSIQEKALLAQIHRFLDGLRMPPEFYAYALKWFRKEQGKDAAIQESVFRAKQQAYESCQRKLDQLIDMRAAEVITDEEFLRKRAQMSLEKVRQEHGSDEESQALELAEDLLSFLRDAKSQLQGGSPEEQREIMLALGSDRFLRDGKLRFELQKPLFSLRKAASIARRINERLGPPNNGSPEGFSEQIYDRIPVMSALLEDVRTGLRSLSTDLRFGMMRKWRKTQDGKSAQALSENFQTRPGPD